MGCPRMPWTWPRHAVHFAAAIFTNLTQDHLDYHHTMEEYFLAKRRLFVPSADAFRPVA